MMSSFVKLWKLCVNQRKEFITTVIMNFLKNCFMTFQLFAIIILIRELVGESNDNNAILKIIIMGIICIIGSFFVSLHEQITALTANCYMVRDKRLEIGNILKNVNLGFFSSIQSEKITSTLTTMMTTIENTAIYAISNVTSGLFSAVAFFIILMFYQYQIGIIAGIGMIVYFLLVMSEMKTSKKYAPQMQKANNELIASALSYIQGIKVSKAFNYKENNKKIFEDISRAKDANINLVNVTMPGKFAGNLCIAVFECIIIIAVLFLYMNQEAISLTKAVVLLTVSFMVYSGMVQSGGVLSMIGILDASLDAVNELENTKQLEIKKPVEKIKNNEIVLENVCFSLDGNKIIDNVSTIIKENSLTAVIGPSGSGKTTLCRLIAGFWNIDSGKITIGGADITHVTSEELMSRISMVFQKVYLFEDTIENNIRFGNPDASHDDVIKAAKAARCHDFIMQLPDGYDTVVSEGGGSLSGGEKQRISIARAMLKEAPIVILDEATSALDTENEKAVLEAIDELTKNKTVIMIAHRMKTIQNADHIIAVSDGKIIQEGKHDDLIKQDGLYKNFVQGRKQALNWKL